MGGDSRRRRRGARGAAKNCFGREGAEVLAVQPLELGEVEDGAAEADVVEVEVLDHLGERELFGDAVGPCSWSAGMPPPMRPRKLRMASGRKPAWR